MIQWAVLQQLIAYASLTGVEINLVPKAVAELLVFSQESLNLNVHDARRRCKERRW